MEPQAETFLRWLGDDYVRDEAQIAELRRAIDDLGVLQDMFSSRGWELLSTRLREVEAQDIKALETCSLEDVQRYRDRLGWWRFLLEQPQRTKHELENTKTLLSEHEMEV